MTVPAGDLARWVAQMQATLRGDAEADVPCGDCTACCRSSQFIHLTPADDAARRRIPRALLFPAPQRPRGHHVLGYDERGHCPMLVETGCSIYAERPQTCRSYDCRIFAATGVQPDQPAVAERVREWRFTLGEGDAARLAALRAAAAWLAAHPDEIPEPRTALQRAAHAVMIHERFLG